MNKTNITVEGKTFSSKDVAAADKESTFFFYTQENVQPSSSITDYDKREERFSKDDRSFKNAPENATYVVVKGRYSGPGGKDADGNDFGDVTGNVEYTIHLGDFSESSGSNGNFTVRRNVKYTYYVTVAGVNNIIVEATTETGDFQHGAEGDIMKENKANAVRVDAHYEQVLLALEITLPIDKNDLTLQIRTPYTDKIVHSIEELKDDDDLNWLKFGKPATSSTFDTYANVYEKGLCNIKALLEMLSGEKTGLDDYCIKEDGKVYIAAYVDEYYYQDKPKLAEFINVDDREMRLSTLVNTSADGHSTYTTTPIFSIAQRSIKSMMNLDMDNPFGLESVEEETEQAYINYNANSINGRDPKNSTSSSFGWNNFYGLFSSSSEWSTYINDAKNGYIGGVRESGMTTGYDYALYRVLSRNRDIDGDGKISGDEVRWYLPSHHQCLAIWYGNNSLPAETRIDVSSRENKTYLTSSCNNANRVWWADEGVCFGAWNDWNSTASSRSSKTSVRAVRSLKNYAGETTKVSSYNSESRIVTVNGLSEDCVRNYMISGNYSEHYRGSIEDRLPTAFQIAEKYLSGSFTAKDAATDSNLGSEYSEEDDGSDKGLWRVPNEKELGLIAEWLGFSSDNTNTIGRTRYTDIRYYYYIWETKNNYGHLTTHSLVTGDTSVKILLVRDVEPVSGNNTNASESSYVNGGIGVR